ncbi:glycoside hydrolase family 47 protein [Panaeolus papilionaceus]|nr:glycoside hydrolase family 47 protein [Panaeolus papilionaceus]
MSLSSTDDGGYLRRPRFYLTRPILRRFLYGIVFFSVVYALIYFTIPPEAFQLIPEYIKKINFSRPANQAHWRAKATEVKEAFLHAYSGYYTFAAPHDELKPLSNKSIDNFNGWGVTVFDSLDTMILMGLKEELAQAKEIIRAADFSKAVQTSGVPFFETVIRYLGGLLSAYALTSDRLFLERADDLAIALDPVFHPQTGLPYFSVNTTIGQPDGPPYGILAEIGSLQLEYSYLAKITGNPSHFNRSQTIMNLFKTTDLKATGGMLPVQWDIGKPGTMNGRCHISVGAQADSAHEYLLKLYLLTGKTDKDSLELYLRATTRIITDLLYLSPTRHLLYVTDKWTTSSYQDAYPSNTLEHLSCFLPGLLALGAHTLPLDNLKSVGVNFTALGNETVYGRTGYNYERLSQFSLKDVHMWAAEGIAQTCWMTYADQPSGLGPDEVTFVPTDTQPGGGVAWSLLWFDYLENWKKSHIRGPPPGLAEVQPVVLMAEDTLGGTTNTRDYAAKDPRYLLRPEKTVESLYILWRTTGDEKWRHKAWSIFEAIQRETRTSSGYASIISVLSSPAPQEDSMPSYFLAETLKYLYLIFTDEDKVPLNKWVFNTEAHPLPIFKWTVEEKARFGI